LRNSFRHLILRNGNGITQISLESKQKTRKGST
jgi:hypothetical protein